jgi:hypothetical protein
VLVCPDMTCEEVQHVLGKFIFVSDLCMFNWVL